MQQDKQNLFGPRPPVLRLVRSSDHQKNAMNYTMKAGSTVFKGEVVDKKPVIHEDKKRKRD